jgi:iron complex outermembrane receptor protein
MRTPRTPQLLVVAAVVLVFGTLSDVRSAATQGESGALLVSVTARAGGRPLEGAEVIVVGTPISARTNSAGVVRIAGVPLGLQTVEVRRLGYSTRLRLLTLEDGRASSATFALEEEAIRLAEIRVEAEPERGNSHLDRTGFTRRRAMGTGKFVTRAEFEGQMPSFLSDVIRRFPGVTITPFSGLRGGQATFSRNLRGCSIQYFVDGTLIGPSFNVDDIPARDVEAVEVYRGTSEVPAEFNRRSAACGVIAIWTRIE